MIGSRRDWRRGEVKSINAITRSTCKGLNYHTRAAILLGGMTHSTDIDHWGLISHSPSLSHLFAR